MPDLQWLADRLAQGAGDDENHGISAIGHIIESVPSFSKWDRLHESSSF